MKISWTVQSVDSVHRTAVVTYLCGDHRIALNISILSPFAAERDIRRAVPVAQFARLLSANSHADLASLVGTSGEADMNMSEQPTPRHSATAGTVVA